MRNRIILLSLLGLACAASAQLPPEVQKSRDDAIARLQTVQPGVWFLHQGVQIDRVYGPAFGGGLSPEGSFQAFMQSYSGLFGPGDARLELVETQSLMNGKFIAGTFREFYEGIPVDQGQVTLLCRDEFGFPIVLAVGGSQTVLGPIAPPSISAKSALQAIKRRHRRFDTFEQPSLIIWSGETRSHLAWTFIAGGPPPDHDHDAIPERIQAFVDAHSGKVLEERQAIWSVDVNGTVAGWATPGLFPDQPGNSPTQQPMASLRVNITGGNAAFTAGNGSYVISNAGTAPVTVNAGMLGRWVNVTNSAGTTMSLSQTVTPPGPANFVFNPAPAEFTTAQVNGFIQTTRVHDFVKSVHPTYPGVDIALPCRVNVAGSCNAFFSSSGGGNINFYRASTTPGSCPNMAYSTVVYHEYGHFVIWAGGTSQGAYGEGMSDTIACLLADSPNTGEDFRGPGTGPLRSAINSVTYPSAAEIHAAGNIVSGAFWTTLQQLEGSLGHAAALALVRQWAINSILLHPPRISPGMTVDVLTLDDNDANISNGTPHYNQIAAGFGAKGLLAPPIEWIKWTPQIIPGSFTPFNAGQAYFKAFFDVRSNAGTLNPNTLTGFVRWNDGAWFEVPAYFESQTSTCEVLLKRTPFSGMMMDWYVQGADTQGRITRYPLGAPLEFGSTVMGSSLATIVEDMMETGAGWTVSNDPSLTSGGWTRANPNGTSLNGWAANPENDSTDSGVNCFFTGQGAAGGAAGDADVDGGPTSLTSPTYNLAGFDHIIEYKRWFFNDDGDDFLVVEVSNDNGATWQTVETVAGFQFGVVPANSWVQRSFRLNKYVASTSQVKLRFRTSDNPNNSITEAAIDHVVIRRIVP